MQVWTEVISICCHSHESENRVEKPWERRGGFRLGELHITDQVSDILLFVYLSCRFFGTASSLVEFSFVIQELVCPPSTERSVWHEKEWQSRMYRRGFSFFQVLRNVRTGSIYVNWTNPHSDHLIRFVFINKRIHFNINDT